MIQGLKKNKEILKLEVRNRIYMLVSKFAGSHIREIERISKIPYSTLKYHLHFLAKHSLIIERKENKNIKYYPKTIRFDDIKLLGLLRQKNIRKILLYLVTSENCTSSELEEFLALSPSTINWYMENLVKKGIIKKNKEGKKVNYTLNFDKEELIRILLAYKEGFFDVLVDRVIEMWEVR